MSKPLEKFPYCVSAVAAIVVLISCIAVGAPLHMMASWVSLTIVVFLLLGFAFRMMLVTAFFPLEAEEGEEGEDGIVMELYEEPQAENEEGGEVANVADGEGLEEEAESAAVGNAFLDS